MILGLDIATFNGIVVLFSAVLTAGYGLYQRLRRRSLAKNGYKPGLAERDKRRDARHLEYGSYGLALLFIVTGSIRLYYSMT